MKMVKKLYWYVVYWRNKAFLSTRFKPNKVGSVFGRDTLAQRFGDYWYRAGVLKGDFRIVEKYAF